MGRCLDLLDRPGDALKAFATAAHLGPYLAETQFEYGRALSSADVVSSAALAAASAAVTSDMNFDEARLLKGRLAYEMGDVDSAYSEFSILTARHPDSSDYQIWKRRAFDEILRGR
jgi:cytochrome c-type biogenesis protein CcmH/NrfG